MTKRKKYTEPLLYKSDKSLADLTLGPFCSSDFDDGCKKEEKEKIKLK